MIRHFDLQLSREKDPLRLGRLHYELARLYESPLRDLGNASDHYQKAYALCPDHLPTLRGARRVMVAKKAFQAALPLFDAESRFTSDPALKAVLSFEKGRVLEEHLGQKRDAREAYVAALELDPQNATYLKALERTDLAAKAWDALDKTYEKTASAVAADPRHRAALLVQRAQLIESKKGDSRTATELYNEALGFDQRAPGALDALKRLHYAHQRWRDLAGVLQREAEQASDPAVRAMAYYRMGRVLADRLGHLDEALTAFERAAAELPSDPMVLEELTRLYELGKRWDALASVLERLSMLVRTDIERLGMFHRIGQIAEERLDDEDRAVEWFSRALAAEPTYLPALQALGKILTRRKHWDALISMHLREAEVTSDVTRRAAAHARVAAIYEEQLGNVEQAVFHHAKALGVLRGYLPSFKALSRIYQESGKWRELVELFERVVDEAQDTETKITYLFKIGRVHEDALGSPLHALGAYKRVLGVSPDHMGAIHAMQRSAERGGRYKDLVTALEHEARLVKDKRQSVTLLHRAGEVLEQNLGDLDAALTLYRRVIELDKTYQPALSSLGRLYYEAGRWEDLLETYKRELEVAPKGTAAAALLYKMGELAEERVGRDEEAMGYYRRAIDADPFHIPALHSLARKLSERGQWAELTKLIELELSGLKDGDSKARTAFHLGEVYENRLSQPDKALAAYEQAVGSVPTFRPAIDGRARLLAQTRDHRRIVEELAREAASATEPMIAVAAQFRLGEVYRDELADTLRAIEAFENVLAQDPSHLGALLALEPLYGEVGNWEALARIYATQARVLGDPSARVAALRELARLEELRGVGGADEIRGAYIAILQLAPSDPAALAALERLAISSGDSQLLTHVDAKLGAALATKELAAVHQTRLAETLEQMGDPSAFETYRGALARDPDNLSAAAGIVRLADESDDPIVLREAAEAAFGVLDDGDKGAHLLVRAAGELMSRRDRDAAIGALELALEKHPDSAEALEALRRVLMEAGQIDRLFDDLCQAAQWARDLERMAALWLVVSEILADQKSDVPAAIAALHRTIDELPKHVPTLMRLAELYARDRQWAEAVDRLMQTLGTKPTADVEARAHLMLARILKEHLGDEARALVSIQRVLELEPNNREALGRRLEIEMRRGQASEAATTAAQLVSAAASDDERAAALCHLARLERQNKHTDAALHAYEQAVALTGDDGPALGELRDLLLEQKLLGEDPAWNNYVSALVAYSERVTDLPHRSQVFLEVARVLADEMGQTDRCLQTLQRALSADPENNELRSELAERLKAAGHHQPAIAEFRHLLEADVSRPASWRGIVECFQALGRTEEATLAMAPMVALGFGNDLERATISSRLPRTAHARPGAFDEVAFRGLDSRGTDTAAALLGAIAEGLGKVHPPELERYGLTTRDRITSRTGHPLKVLADRIAATFGEIAFDIYLHRAHQGSLEIELTDPPGILVPYHVTSLREPEQVFLLARSIALLARGLQAVQRLAPAEIALLLIAAGRTVDPTYGAGVADEEFLNQHAKRIQKSLSRRSRRTLEEVAPTFLASGAFKVEPWVMDHRKSAVRAAIVLADDLPGSVGLLRRTEGDLAGLRGAALQQGVALVQDALRFWASDAAFALRRRLGMM